MPVTRTCRQGDESDESKEETRENRLEEEEEESRLGEEDSWGELGEGEEDSWDDLGEGDIHTHNPNTTNTEFFFRNTPHPTHKFSSYLLTDTDISLLSKGLSFTPTTQILQLSLPRHIRQFQEKRYDDNTTYYLHILRSLPPNEILVVRTFKQHKSTITIKPPDKHLGTVLLNTDKYIDLCLQHLTKKAPSIIR